MSITNEQKFNWICDSISLIHKTWKTTHAFTIESAVKEIESYLPYARTLGEWAEEAESEINNRSVAIQEDYRTIGIDC